MNRLKQISLYLTAGAVGALVNSLVVWAAGTTGLTAALGAKIAPTLTPPWLYQRLIWGALWGLLFFIPMKRTFNTRKNIVRRGLLVSLGPTLAQLLFFFPSTGKGWLGIQLGVIVPLLVIIFNAIWGIVAAAWIETAKG
ncbi:hypothetical protein [Lyngbya aestuarii]|uniref:hypothetical protein n=1 Tax=Lyngbya aestuarii TaxID=118322 RepID=UPI00403DF929